MIAGEEYLVLARGAARDADGHGAGLAAALGVAHHLRAGDGVDQKLGKLDLQRAVQGKQAALPDLLPHRAVDHVVGMAEDDRRHRVHPVDVLVAVHVDEPRTLGMIGVYRTDRVREAARPPADELRLAGDQLFRAVVEIEGCCTLLFVVVMFVLLLRSNSVVALLNADTIVESLDRFDNPINRVIDFSHSGRGEQRPVPELEFKGKQHIYGQR